MRSNSRERVFIIGLDGGTWDVFRPLMEENLMPNLAQLAQEGVSGQLESTIPCVTAPAWASFQTGVNPGKHGVFEFTDFDPGTHRTSLVSSHNIRAKTIWELVSEAGKRVVVINVPLTYPPRPVNGAIISGLTSPSIDNRVSPKMTYPCFVYDELIRAVEDYEILVNQTTCYLEGAERFVDDLVRVSRKRAEAAAYFMDRYDWDLFMVHFQNLDPLQHALWYAIDRSHPCHDVDAWHQAVRYYQAVDGIIGEFRDILGDDVTLIVLSDHGFGRMDSTFNLQAWLLAEGMLSLDTEGLKRARIGERIIALAKRLDVFNLRALLISNERNREIKERVKRNIQPNWGQTRAYAPGGPGVYGRIYLNGDGKDEAFREALVGKLERVVDPNTGQRVVKRVYRREEVYQGPWLETAPDLIVEPNEGYIVGSVLGAEAQPLFGTMEAGKQDVGTHRQRGMLVLAGKSIQVDCILQKAAIIDLAPTVLFLLGLPIPRQMDGRVLMSAFISTLRKHAAPSFTDVAILRNGEAWQEGYSTAEQVKVEERLRALGYLD